MQPPPMHIDKGNKPKKMIKFTPSFLEGLERFLDSSVLSDLTIRFGQRTTKVHKIVLCNQSGWFRKALEGEFQEATQREIELFDDDPDSVDGMLKHFYGVDPVTKHDDPASELLKIVAIRVVADKYDVPALGMCMTERFKATSEENWESLWLSRKISPVIESVFASIPSPSDGIRVTIVALTLNHITKLRDSSVNQYRSILEEDPDFSADLVLALVQAQVKAAAELAEMAAKIPAYKTELHGCAERGETETCRALLAQGAAVDARDENGETPLHFAVYFGFLETARSLVDNGADINATSTSFQSTPLRWARMTGRADLEAYLVGLGAVDGGNE